MFKSVIFFNTRFKEVRMLLTYDLTKRGKLPLYEYLYRCIRSDCETGRLKRGEKLPSKRALASHLNLSVVTVENAYAQLLSEGYLTTRERSGYFVTGLFVPARKDSESGLSGSSDASYSTNVVPSVSKHYDSSESASQVVLDFTANELSPEHFPFSVWSRLSREVLATRQAELLVRIPTEGIFELRKAISDYLYEFRGFRCDPSQIIIGAGAEYLYQLLIQLFSRKAHFVLEDPGYPKTAMIYRLNEAPFSYVPMDSEGILPGRLPKDDRSPVIVHTSPSHHYPTGIITSPARRAELLSWAHESDNRYLLEDEYDSEFRFTGKPLPTLFGTDRGQKVIYLNTFSKSIAPSIRISFLVLPKELSERFHRTLSFYSCTVPSFEQYTLARFLSEGHLTRHVSRVKMAYRRTRNELIRMLSESRLSEHVTIHEEDAGLHLLLRVHTELPDSEILAKALSAGVRLQSVGDFCVHTAAHFPHTFVVNYSGLTEEKLKQVPGVFSKLEKVFSS